MINTLSIMLIDDNAIDLFLNKKFIEAQKIAYKTFKYEYADDAFQYLKNAMPADWPNVILLDIHMPVMDGFEFLKLYETLPEERRKNTHIIMVSSTLNSKDNQRALENPSVTALLTKPLNMVEMTEILKEKGIL